MRKFPVWALIVLIVIGSCLVYYQITGLKTIRHDEVLIPTNDGRWTNPLFFIEEPSLDLNNYTIANENKLLPSFYQDSIPEVQLEILAYLGKRNKIISFFETKYCSKNQQGENTSVSSFLEPFHSCSEIQEILPVSTDVEEYIVVIGKKPFSAGHYIYFLDSNLNVMQEHKSTDLYEGCSVLSIQFPDRVWIQTVNVAGVSYTMNIEHILIENNHLTFNNEYREAVYDNKNVLDTFKITHVSSNPELAVYDKGKSTFIYTTFLILYFLTGIPPNILLILLLLIVLGIALLIFFERRSKKW